LSQLAPGAAAVLPSVFLKMASRSRSPMDEVKKAEASKEGNKAEKKAKKESRK
jgi:hypothetical protein